MKQHRGSARTHTQTLIIFSSGLNPESGVSSLSFGSGIEPFEFVLKNSKRDVNELFRFVGVIPTLGGVVLSENSKRDVNELFRFGCVIPTLGGVILSMGE